MITVLDSLDLSAASGPHDPGIALRTEHPSFAQDLSLGSLSARAQVTATMVRSQLTMCAGDLVAPVTLRFLTGLHARAKESPTCAVEAVDRIDGIQLDRLVIVPPGQLVAAPLLDGFDGQCDVAAFGKLSILKLASDVLGEARLAVQMFARENDRRCLAGQCLVTYGAFEAVVVTRRLRISHQKQRMQCRCSALSRRWAPASSISGKCRVCYAAIASFVALCRRHIIQTFGPYMVFTY